jgi:hypothetical protein
MAIHAFTPSTYQHDLALLNDLHTTLHLIPDEAYVPSIINYTIFPLTHLLQRNNPISSEEAGNTRGRIPDRILERLFECLAFLIERWKRTPNGIDLNMWEQLWTLSVLLVGGPLQPMDPRRMRSSGSMGDGKQDKGKGRALSEESKLAVLGLMKALLEPISEDIQQNLQDGSDDEDDGATFLPSGKRTHPTSSHLDRLYNSKILPPILFHTISSLLDISLPSTADSQPIIPIESLKILTHLVVVYMKDKIEMLASVLPGMVSNSLKILNNGPGPGSSTSGEAGGKQIKEKVAIATIGLLKAVLVGTLGDEVLVRKEVLKRKVTSLDELVEEINLNAGGVDGIDDTSENGTLEVSTTNKTGAGIPKAAPQRPEPFPALTSQYLEFTSAQLSTSFKVVLPTLRTHTSPLVRGELVNLCEALLVVCHRSLHNLQVALLEVLLQATMDEHDQVSWKARRVSNSLIGTSDSEIYVETDVAEEMRSRLRAIANKTLAGFPGAIMSQSEAKTLEATRIITALSRLVVDVDRNFNSAADSDSASSSGFKPFHDLLGPNSGMQRWVWPLLVCLELGRAKELAVPGAGYAERAWAMARLGSSYEHLKIEGARSTNASADAEQGIAPGQASGPEFPELFLKRVESPNLLKAIGEMFESLGEAAGLDALNAVEQFVAIAKAKKGSTDVPKAASALWAAERIMAGLVTSRHIDDKRLRKEARSIVRTLIMFDDEEEEMEEPQHDEQQESVSDELMVVEKKQGINALTNLLKRDHRGNQTTERENRTLHIKTHRELVTALSLSLMSVCARILGSSFRPMLLNTLYIVLSHLGSPVAFIRGYAEIALMRIAYDIGYASPQNMIIDNVDYVINVVSQRMTYQRLSPLAPMVLISMIRLVGEPIVPLVQDIVDDIFDCLDDYHGYELLASTMLAVLDTLMRAMTNETHLAEWTPPVSTSKRLRPGPDPARDFEAFAEWYRGRATRAAEAVDDLIESTPREAWKREGQGEDGDENGDDPDDPPENARDEPEIPPTRTQEVCKRMMEKDVYFMTHSSPFVRARVLTLFTNGIPVLMTGNRESDLLPLVNTAWPYILNRLQDKEPYVVTEAAVLLEALAKWVGDFMSRRILDNAWPILKKILATQKRLDDQSALLRRGQGGVSTSHTVSHRLHLAIINTMRYIVKEVPVADSVIWETIMLFRPFLDNRVHQEQQDAAVQLYRMLVNRDEDAVWVVLSGTVGEIADSKGRLAYLRQPGLNIHDNKRLVLGRT